MDIKLKAYLICSKGSSDITQWVFAANKWNAFLAASLILRVTDNCIVNDEIPIDQVTRLGVSVGRVITDMAGNIWGYEGIREKR